MMTSTRKSTKAQGIALVLAQTATSRIILVSVPAADSKMRRYLALESCYCQPFKAS